MGLDDPPDLHQLAPIVSRGLLEPGTVQPELRMTAVSLYMDVRWLLSVDGAKPERKSAFAVNGRHAPMLGGRAYVRLTIRL